MIRILSGSEDELKQKVLQYRKHYQKEIQTINRKLKGLRQEERRLRKKGLTKDADTMRNTRIEPLEDAMEEYKRMKAPYDYPVTRISPVKVGGVVFNQKPLQQLQNKLKGFEIQTRTTEDFHIEVTYRNNKGTSGTFTLTPLGGGGSLIDMIPEAEVVES